MCTVSVFVEYWTEMLSVFMGYWTEMLSVFVGYWTEMLSGLCCFEMRLVSFFVLKRGVLQVGLSLIHI